MGWCLQASPTQLPSLLGQGQESLLVVFLTAGLALAAGGYQRFFEVSPDRLDRREMLGRPARLRPYRCERCGAAVGVIRAGHGDLEAEVFAVWQTVPGVRTMLRRRCMGDQEAGMRLLDDHHTVVRAQRVVAVHGTRRGRSERQHWLQHRLGGGHMRANGIQPACDR